MEDKDEIVGTDNIWDPATIFTNYEPDEEEKDESIENILFGTGSAVLPTIETPAGPMPVAKEDGDVIIQWQENEDGGKSPVPVKVGDPTQTEFYKQTIAVVNELNDIQLEPVMQGVAATKAGRLKHYFPDLKFEDVQLIDVDKTIAQVDEALENIPDILVENKTLQRNYWEDEYPTEIVTQPLTWNKILAIREGNKKRGEYGRVTEADVGREGFTADLLDMSPPTRDNIGDPMYNVAEHEAFINEYQDQITAIIDAGGSVPDAVRKILYGDDVTIEELELYNTVYDVQDFKNIEEFQSFNSNIRGFTKTQVNVDAYEFDAINEIDYLENKFSVDEKAYEYIRDAIVKKFDFADFDNYAEYVDAVAKYTQTLTAVDPLMQRTVINANLVLANEANVKYLELLDAAREAGTLDDPRALENLNREYTKWQETRYMELLDGSDYEARSLQYEFAVHQVLKDLYIPFGRSKDGTYSELDKELAEGKTSEWWYRIRNTASNSYTKFKQGLRGLAMKPRASLHASLVADVATLEKYAADIEKYNLGDYNVHQLRAWLDDNRDKIGEAEYTMLKQQLDPLFDGRATYTGGYETLNELEKNLNKQLKRNIDYLGESINANILDNERLSLVEELGDDDSILGLVESIMDQSNMIFMFGGMALKQTRNPYAYAVGTILDALGTADIVAKTMSGDMWAVLDGKIKARKGEDYVPTRDDYLAELEDPDSINMLANMISTGAQLAGERFSLGKILKYGNVGRKRVASIIRGQFKKYLYTVPAVIGASQISGLQEYIVEGTQGLISDINQKYQIAGNRGTIFDAVQQGKFDFVGAKQGRKIGQFLPVAGAVVNQSYIELTQISEIIVSRFNQNSNAAANEAFYTQALDKIRLDIKNKKITEQEGNEAIEIISHYRNIGLKIPKNLDGRKRRRVVRLLVEKKNLEEQIKKINDKDLTVEEQLRLNEVSAEVQLIIADTKQKEEYIKQVGNVLDIINDSETSNVKVIRSKDAKGIEKQREKLNEEGWNIAASKGLSTNYGTIFQKGDQQVILLNDQEILKDGAINTAAHEFLHAVLWNTVKNSKGTALSLGNNLLEYLNEVDTNLIKDSELATRIQAYKDDPKVTNEQQAEEVLTLFSEALLDGAIAESAFDGNFGQRLGDLFTRILETLGFSSDIRFDTGRDVYKFIKGYNASIKKGKFTEAQTKVFKEGAKGELIKRNYTTKDMRQRDGALEKSSKKLTELTTEYKEGNFDNVEELSTQYQKTGKDALKRWAAQRGVSINLGNPQVDQEVTSLLNKEFDSFTRNFDPSKAQASTYMENIAKRVGPKIVEEGTRKGKQVSTDVLNEKGFSPETTTQPDLDVKTQPTGKRAKVFPNKIKTISDKITGETRADQIIMLKNDIIEGILRVGAKPKAIAKYIVEKTKTKEYRKLIKDKLGVFGSKQYIDTVNSLFANTDFISAIPVANIKRRFGKLFGISKTGTIPTVKIEDGKETRYDKGVYNVPAISKAKLSRVRNYFLAADGEKRSQSLFSIIGEGLAVEAIQELSTDPEFMKELENRLNFKNSNLNATQFMAELEFDLDKRNLEDTSLDIVKANKKRKPRSYKQIAYDTAARATMRQVAGQNSVFNHKNIKDSQKSIRRTGSIIMIHGLGKDAQQTGNYGNVQSIYKSVKEFEKDVFNTPLTENEIKLLEKFNIPLVTRRGKTYYDQSKAKKSAELGIDETIMVKGKPKSVLQLARSEQAKYKFLSPGQARKELNNEEFQELQEAKLRVLKNIAKKIEADLAIDPALKNYWAAWLNQSGDQVIHPVRSLAPVEFFETRKGDKVAEHTLPASQVGTMIMRMAIDGKVDENFEFIDKDYFQGSILERDDVKLKGEGYNYVYNMPNIFFDIKNPTTWMRYIDKMVNNNKSGGININNIIIRKNGKVITLAESFKLPLTKRAIPGLIRYQNNLLYDVFRGAMTIQEAQARLEVAENTGIKEAENIQVQYNGKILAPGVLPTDSTPEYSKKVAQNSLETRVNAFKESKKRKGISVFDFDDTLAKTKEKVIVIMPNGKRKKISASQFAAKADALKAKGADFDFSNFDKVSKNTAEGPLADLARKRQGKFGSGDIFVLTARPQVSAQSIKEFLDGIGINIPLENITGLSDGSPQAKVDWMLNKTAEGYNDFYFADDSFANVISVKNILDAVDVKNEVYQAKASKKKDLNTEFNEMVEYATGKEAFKTYSNARARLEGAKKDGGLFKRFLRQFKITASADDFLGLTYAFLGKGEQGSANMKWVYDNLYSLYSKAEQELLSARVSVANDFAALRAKFPTLKRQPFNPKRPLETFTNPLLQPIGVGPYTKSQAVRVYLWNKQGLEIPGMSQTDVKRLVKAVQSDTELNVFADELQLVNKTKNYPKPDKNWLAGNIKDDVLRGIDTEFRSQLMSQFNENVKLVFTPENLNKLEALFGSKYREALEDSLRRMKSGSNRPIYIGGGSRMVNEMLDYMNASVGVTMFLNMRSGLLQMISNVNFINWGDNNIYNAAKAFANQKQYWKDVMFLMNSDYLVNRRDGLKINVNEAELVDAGRKGGFKGVLSYLLDKGFIITRTVDSLAIATGGATFYRNRYAALLKRTNPDTGNLYTEKEASEKAFDDFYLIAEESQQSSNPARISQQQASLAGRFILSFQNVTMQYNRVTKKAVQDLYNRRRRPGQTQREADLSNISKIVYYTTMQNLLFNGLQNTLFSALFEDDELEKSKVTSTANGMVDSLLFGLGFGGAIVSTVKNVLMVVATEQEKESPDYEEAVWELFNISPVLDIKVRKFRTGAKTFKWNKKEIARRGWNIDNPAYLAVAQFVSATFNIPIDRLLRKMMNVAQALDSEVQTWQRVALILGWQGWNLDLPYWGRQSTIEREAAEDAKLEADYKKEFYRLKDAGYKRRPMTKGRPAGKLNVDYIEVKRPNGKIEFWLTPEK